jgi:hypothetical protein
MLRQLLLQRPAVALPTPWLAPAAQLPHGIALAPAFAATSAGWLQPTQLNLIFAHWYAGRAKRHRYAREKRYHPKYDVAKIGRNAFSRKLHWKTNRWNYQQAHRDMP